MRKIKISGKRLEELYLDKGLTTYQIADKLNCCQATVWKKLHNFNIKLRSAGPPRVDLTEEKLGKLYVDMGLSTWEIEEKYGYPRSTVYRKLREYGIEPRSRAESHVIYPRKSFSGDLTEKAYLVGFTMGDLRARIVYENSETVKIDCGSTKSEQINLIKKLFQKYGRIWVSEPGKNGKIQIEAFLDLSFDFLLSSKKELHEWILDSSTYFPHFLAGFTDAEGSIFIRGGMAVYSLGNYDKELLFSIHQRLTENDIICPKPYEDKTKGYVTREGYIHNQNYCNLCVHRKSSLLKLFNLIGPHLKHSERIKCMKRAIENIEMRNRMFGAN